MTIETLEQVVGLLAEYPVAEITLERGGERVCVRRGAVAFAPPAPPLPAPASAAGGGDNRSAADADAAALPAAEPVLLLAPMVGLFHHLPAPPRYGMGIAEGQVVGHIESMKLMNDVLAEQAGQVVEVLVEDGGPVEYGQPLFRLAP